MKKRKTLAQARAWFHRTGTPVSAWARDHGYTPSLVFEILAGRKRCLRGKSHRIAVLLGIKEGEIVEKGAQP